MIVRSGLDIFIFVAAYLLANYARFSVLWKIDDYIFPITAGAISLVSIIYIFGLYSVESHRRSSFWIHAMLLLFAFALALMVITMLGYLQFDLRIGRGFMAFGCLFSLPLLLLNHWLLYHKHQIAPDRVALVAETEAEMQEYLRMREFCLPGIHLVGRIGVERDEDSDNEYLGRLCNIRKLIRQHRLDRIVFLEQRLNDEKALQEFRMLRYLGIHCSRVISLCEKHLHYVPLHLVSMQWLVSSELSSRNLYFSKLKRLFDVTISLVLLVMLAPFLLLGICLVRLFSPEGPVFFRQERVGRFGKRFKIYKLRSMRTDAEKGGAVWSSVSKDPRVFPGGAFMRKYRIDEIPQLLNVFRGEMSFVGPRPERPEFVSKLARSLPYYQERHMIQPGLTGWAQVCYPYGASVEDARCKLEYDLYYLKHAGVLFDSLILLDTVRVVLGGGLKNTGKYRYPASVPAETESGRTQSTVADAEHTLTQAA